MITVNVSQDEWYPIYTIDCGELPEALQKYYTTFEIDLDTLMHFRKVFSEFYIVQSKLEYLYNLHKEK